MTDPVISPDGKWMWTGSEWIPAPPAAEPVSVSMQDSVIAGDVNITQNNAEDIAAAMVTALERIGFSGQSSPAELTPSQEAEVEQVLEMSEQLASHGIEIDPWSEITLGNAAILAGRTHLAQQHYLRALETFRKNGDRGGEAKSLNNLGSIAKTRGDLAEAKRLHQESLAIKREIGDRQGEAQSLGNLGIIAQTRGDLAEAERLHRVSLAIDREIGYRQGVGETLQNLGELNLHSGNYADAEKYYRESSVISTETGNQTLLARNLGGLGVVLLRNGDYIGAEKSQRKSLSIRRDIGDLQGVAAALIGLGGVLLQRNIPEHYECYKEAVEIHRQMGIPIDPWFIENGY
jgi:tetratricopeptide (TPR) repeat protein